MESWVAFCFPAHLTRAKKSKLWLICSLALYGNFTFFFFFHFSSFAHCNMLKICKHRNSGLELQCLPRCMSFAYSQDFNLSWGFYKSGFLCVCVYCKASWWLKGFFSGALHRFSSSQPGLHFISDRSWSLSKWVTRERNTGIKGRERGRERAMEKRMREEPLEWEDEFTRESL